MRQNSYRPNGVAFRKHVKRRGPRARGWTYDAHVEKFVKLGFGGFEFLRREAVWSCRGRVAFGDNVVSNAVFNRGISGARGFFNDGKLSHPEVV